MSPHALLAGRLPLLPSFPDVKDPSLVHDGARWHLFGTGCGRPGGLHVLHAIADDLRGPWRELDPSVVVGVEHIRDVAAPGVVHEGGRFHLFLQHHFNVLGGAVEHLVSDDGGRTFVVHDVALRSVPGTGEAGVYDAEPALIDGDRYLVYAGMSVVGQPDLYLARSGSGSWGGPWQRLGPILLHEHVAWHNQLDDVDYEWGLEGPHLVELPDGRCLLTAVGFLTGREAGHRQRVLLAVADAPTGPYEVLDALIEPVRGENGHGCTVVSNGAVHVVYQERDGAGRPWHYRRAVLALDGVASTERLAS